METKNNYNKVYLDENIFYIDDFVSDEEIQKILSMDLNWENNRNDTHQNVLTAIFSKSSDMTYFKDTVENRIRSIVDNDTQKFRTRNMLTKYLPKQDSCSDNCGCHGNALGFHYENHPECDYESRWITLSIVLYFNDDYSGGELVFEHKPIEVKPKKGTLIVFPSSEQYSHAVKEVYDKERIVFAAFVYGKLYWDILYRSGLVA